MAKAATVTVGLLSALWGYVAVQLAVSELRAPHPEEEVWIFVLPISACAVTGLFLTWNALRRPGSGELQLGRFALALAAVAGLIPFPAPLDQSPPWGRGTLAGWALMIANIAMLSIASLPLLRSGRERDGRGRVGPVRA